MRFELIADLATAFFFVAGGGFIVFMLWLGKRKGWIEWGQVSTRDAINFLKRKERREIKEKH